MLCEEALVCRLEWNLFRKRNTSTVSICKNTQNNIGETHRFVAGGQIDPSIQRTVFKRYQWRKQETVFFFFWQDNKKNSKILATLDISKSQIKPDEEGKKSVVRLIDPASSHKSWNTNEQNARLSLSSRLKL